jgi:tetratricopeptide (TPR) repeat protein
MQKALSIFLLLTLSYTALIGQGQTEKWQKKATQLVEKNNFRKADRYLKKILLQEDYHPDAHFLKAKVHQHFEEYEEAFEHLESAIALLPNEGSYQIGMGNLKYTLGLKQLKTVESCDCGKYIIPEHNGTLTATDFFKSALKNYNRSLELLPNIGETYFQLGMTHYALGNTLASCTAIKKAKKLNYKMAEQVNNANCPNE